MCPQLVCRASRRRAPSRQSLGCKAMALAPVPVATIDQLSVVLGAPPGPWRAKNLQTDAEETVDLLPGKRRLALHGLSACGDVWPRGASAPRLRAARLHFCSAKPCGHKYDPRLEPFLWHGVALEPLSGGQDVRDLGPSAVPSTLAPLAEEPVATDVAPATADHVAADPQGIGLAADEGAVGAPAEPLGTPADGDVDAACSPLALAGASPPGATGAVSVTSVAAPAELDASRPFPLGSMARREALRSLFLSEVEKWRSPGFWLPSFALLVFAVVNGRRLHVVVQQEETDFIARFVPELEELLSGDAEAWVTGSVVVRGDPMAETRSLHWPETEAEVLLTSHWVILVKLPPEFSVPPHDPCGGARCGGAGEPCFGALLEACNALGLVPMPTACDGNCAVDVCCEWVGRSRKRESWRSMRDELAHMCAALVADDLWLSAFDKCFVPTDDELRAARDAEAAARSDAPAGSHTSARTDAPALSRGRSDAPAHSLGTAQMEDVQDEVRSAVEWALGSSIADEMQPIVDQVIPMLGPDARSAWVDKWKSAAPKAPAAPSRLRGARTRRKRRDTATEAAPVGAKPKRRRNRTFFVRETVQLLTRYRKWASTKTERGGALPRGAFKEYLDAVGVATDSSTRQHFKRTYAKIRRIGWREAQASAMPRGGNARQRLLLKQGHRLVKARGLKEALFGWFCMIRGAIAGRLPIDILYAKAEELRVDFIKEALEKKVKPDVPKFLGTGWMSKFMKKYRISLRRPNKRWKVPRKTLLMRLRTMWCNSIRIRTLCWLAHGYDPRASGFDQKPFHINESGSKEARTLSFKGQKEVPLKELHSETRMRWTACTLVVSDPAQARAVPHLECLFKGGPGVLRHLEHDIAAIAPAGLKLSVQVSDTGSYRMEHVLTYLDRALARRPEEASDWRILYCDVYAAHLGDPVSRLAWKHKYVIVIHGGGTTGVAQVNDTHLHQALSREYQRLEQQDMFRQLAREPSKCPTRQRGVCIRDLFLVWQREDIHLGAAQGFLRNMLTNALDGSEDSRASGEVSHFWDELHMADIRKEVIDNVCEEWEAGRLEWSYEIVYGLIEDHAKAGVLDEYMEGQEDEGEDVGDPEPWSDGDEDMQERSQGRASGRVEIVDLSEAQEEEMALVDRKVAILDSTMEMAKEDFPSLVRHARDLRDEVVKQSTVGTDADAQIARAVRAKERLRAEAAIQEKMRLEEAAEKRRVHQEAVEATIARFEQKGEEIAMRERKAEQTAARQRALAAAAARRQAIEDAARGFNAGELGQGQAAGGGERLQRNRFDMLDRVFKLGNELPAEMAANWKVWTRRFDQRGCDEYGRAWGSTFSNMMSSVLEDLRSGDLDACIHFQRYWTRKWSLGAGEVVIPGKL